MVRWFLCRGKAVIFRKKWPHGVIFKTVNWGATNLFFQTDFSPFSYFSNFSMGGIPGNAGTFTAAQEVSPESEACALMLAGLGLVGAAARRRQAQ